MQFAEEQWDAIKHHLPEENLELGKPWRKPRLTREILEAVLWILNTGTQWAELPQKYPPFQEVLRRFQRWCQSDVLKNLLCDLANRLCEEGNIDERECFIDAMLSPAKGGGEEESRKLLKD